MSQIERIEKIIFGCLQEINEYLDIEELKHPNKETRLYGSKSGLDSLALVGLIAEIEDQISEEFGVTVLLADQRAMSQRTSPFRRVITLSDYVNTLIDEAKSA